MDDGADGSVDVSGDAVQVRIGGASVLGYVSDADDGAAAVDAGAKSVSLADGVDERSRLLAQAASIRAAYDAQLKELLRVADEFDPTMLSRGSGKGRSSRS